MWIKNNFDVTNHGFKKNCKTTVIVVLNIFLKLLKSELATMIFYT